MLLLKFDEKLLFENDVDVDEENGFKELFDECGF